MTPFDFLRTRQGMIYNAARLVAMRDGVSQARYFRSWLSTFTNNGTSLPGWLHVAIVRAFNDQQQALGGAPYSWKPKQAISPRHQSRATSRHKRRERAW